MFCGIPRKIGNEWVCRYCFEWKEEKKIVEVIGFSSFPFDRNSSCACCHGLCYWMCIMFAVFVVLFLPITFATVGQAYDNKFQSYIGGITCLNFTLLPDYPHLNNSGLNVTDENNAVLRPVQAVFDLENNPKPPQMFMAMFDDEDIIVKYCGQYFTIVGGENSELVASSIIWNIYDKGMWFITSMLKIPLSKKSDKLRNIILYLVITLVCVFDAIGIFGNNMVFLAFWPVFDFTNTVALTIATLFRSDELERLKVNDRNYFPILYIVDVLGVGGLSDVEGDPLWEKIIRMFIGGSDVAFAIIFFIYQVKEGVVGDIGYLVACIFKVLALSLNIAISFRKYIYIDVPFSCANISKHGDNPTKLPDCCVKFLKQFWTLMAGFVAGVAMFITCLLLILRSIHSMTGDFILFQIPFMAIVVIYMIAITFNARHNRNLYDTRAMFDDVLKFTARKSGETIMAEVSGRTHAIHVLLQELGIEPRDAEAGGGVGTGGVGNYSIQPPQSRDSHEVERDIDENLDRLVEEVNLLIEREIGGDVQEVTLEKPPHLKEEAPPTQLEKCDDAINRWMLRVFASNAKGPQPDIDDREEAMVAEMEGNLNDEFLKYLKPRKRQIKLKPEDNEDQKKKKVLFDSSSSSSTNPLVRSVSSTSIVVSPDHSSSALAPVYSSTSASSSSTTPSVGDDFVGTTPAADTAASPTTIAATPTATTATTPGSSSSSSSTVSASLAERRNAHFNSSAAITSSRPSSPSSSSSFRPSSPSSFRPSSPSSFRPSSPSSSTSGAGSSSAIPRSTSSSSVAERRAAFANAKK